MENIDTNEIERLQLENKKLTRELRRARLITDRNNTIFDAKNRLSDVIMAEKSRMEQYMKLLLDNSRDFILLFDKDRGLVYCTQSYLDATCYGNLALVKGELISELLGSLLDEVSLRKITEYLDHAIFTDEAFGFECDILFPAFCEPRTYRLMARPMWDEKKTAEGFFVTFYDTTDLVNAKKEADRANAAKSDFVATISHDIRTPLNAIIGIAQMMSDTTLDEKQTEYLTKIQRSSVVMLDLINDILDFSKITSSKLELVPEFFDFPKMLKGFCSVFELQMNEKNLAFNVTLADNLPTVVYADAKRIMQILSNLLTNAYKYTPSGWVNFEVSVGSSEESLSDVHTETIVFTIKDTGIGIKEEDYERLFSEFVQLDLVENKNISGTGLGLAITKKLLTLMQGNVEVASVYRKGSTFTATIPLQIGTIRDLPQEEEDISFSAPNAYVLVVDDIDINLEIAKYMLLQLGIGCDTALNGEVALKMVQENDYDLVLMDHMMPVMDGIEATHRIRALPSPKCDIPIVALTANAISGMDEMFTSEGFNGFISKPIDPNTLTKTLLQTLPPELIALD